MFKPITHLKTRETSKKLLIVTGLIFSAVLTVGIIAAFMGKDTSIFMYAIPSAGGVFGATVAFYLNKAKMENIFKGREDFLKHKLDLLEKHSPELRSEIEKELDDLDSILNNTVNSETQEIVNEKINILN